MSWLNRKKEATLPIAVFDVGGSYISAVLLGGDRNNRDIQWSVRLPLGFDAHDDFSKFSRETFRTLGEVSSRLHSYYSGPVDDLHCLLSSPWHVAEASRVFFDDLGPVRKPEDVISNITADSLAKHLDRHRSAGFELVPIDNVVMKTFIDGQPIIKYTGLPGKTLTLHHFASSTDNAVRRRFEEKLEPSFQYKKAQFHSSLLSTFAVTKDALGDDKDFAILDVTGELTDVTIVKNGVIVSIASFPIGKYTVARRLAETTGRSAQTAYSELKICGEGLMSQMEKTRLLSDLQEIKREWLYSLDEVLSGYENHGEGLPLIIIADDAASNLVADWAKEGEGWGADSRTADHEFFADLYPNRRSETKDIPILLAGLFAKNYL